MNSHHNYYVHFHFDSQLFLYLLEVEKYMFNGPFDVTDDTIEVDGPGPLPKVTVDRMDDEVHMSQPESIQIGSDLLPGPSFEMPIDGREGEEEDLADSEDNSETNG